jgi:membrane-bound serine protease (ClpP class)
VVLCKITGMIDDGIAVVVERAVKEARQANALIFVVDTPGGRVDSAIEITRHILGASCPTYAYIEGMGAISAGALISYACDHIVMAPATNIGASTPVTMGTEGMEAVEEKSMSFVRAKYRALGEAKGHNPLIGEAMVDSEIALYGLRAEDGSYTTYKVVDGKVADRYTQNWAGTKVVQEQPPAEEAPAPEGVVLLVNGLLAQAQPGLPDIVRQLTGQPATPPAATLEEKKEAEPPVIYPLPADLPANAELIDGPAQLLTFTTEEALRYGLAAFKADRLEDLLAHFGVAEMTRHYVVPNFAEWLFAWLTSPLISGLLLMIGIGGLYLEVKTPGIGLAGIVGAVCLALFFGAYLVLGIADWMDVILVVGGVVLILVELFIFPGTGVAGVTGIISIVAGLYLAMVRVPIPEYEWDFIRLNYVGQTFVTALVLLVAFVIATWKLLPRTPLWGHLVLADSQLAEAGYVVQTEAQELLSAGLRGHASTMLRPAGRARFNGVLYDVVTRGEFIAPGTPIRIIRADGNRYVVSAEERGETTSE